MLSASQYTAARLSVACQGPIGPRGPQGLEGLTGASGVRGVTGPSGVHGSTGASGVQGVTGASGVSGNQGVTGPSGASGGPGSTGASGVSGNQGSTGPSGASGYQGVTGASGANGSNAPIGSITIWPSATIPTNYLLCDGSTYTPFNEYTSLYNVIGYTFTPKYVFNSYSYTNASSVTLNANGDLRSYFPVDSLIRITFSSPQSFSSGSVTTVQSITVTNIVYNSGPDTTAITGSSLFFSGNGSSAGVVASNSQVFTQFFKLPDMRGRFPIGTGTGFPFGVSGGSAQSTLSANNIPPHRHIQRADNTLGEGVLLKSTGDKGWGPSGNVIDSASNNLYTGDSVVNTDNSVAVSSGNVPSSFSVINPFISLNYIIRYL